jgi:tripeptide aminopeptidase
MSAIVLDARDRQELLERFLRYVQVDTQSDEDSDASPSTEKQKDLARMLAEELRQLGLADARMDDFGYVYATLPANLPAGHRATGRVPPVGLIAHVDTYFATAGGGVKPQVIERYQGGDVALPGDPAMTLRPAENPNLAECVSHTLITSDGTTLLGADDKAGVAEIMTVVAWLQRHQELAHGTLCIAFTPDEEIGRGTDHFDIAAFGAQYAYTLDGADLGEIEDETFCADSALVTIHGHDVHPGYAKGKMTNALRVAAAIVERLPGDRLPETTEGRQPYLHAYGISGDVTRVELKLLVRAFTVEELAEREEALRLAVQQAQRLFPEARITVEIKESYRNMGMKIAEDPKVLEYACEAVRRLGVPLKRKAIRGGTDGARLSFAGILTPNIWAGGQDFHSVQEWVSLEWMAKAVEATLHLVSIWVERTAAPR